MESTLFRKEAIDAQDLHRYGEISLNQPVSVRVAVAVAVGATLLVVLFLCTATYAKRIRVTGQLVPSDGLSTLYAPESGVVSTLSVSEGAAVREGQPLIRLSTPRATSLGGDTYTALSSQWSQRTESLEREKNARQDAFRARSSGLATQLANARLERSRLDVEIQNSQKKVDLAQDTLARLKRLQSDRYVSAIQVNQQESAVLEQASATTALQRQALALDRTLADLQQAQGELTAEREGHAATTQRELSALAREQLEIQMGAEFVLRSPIQGVLGAQLVQVGQTVRAGQPLVSLLPNDDALQALLMLPSRSIGSVAVGDAVLIRYEAYPYQRYGAQQGRISSISRTALSPAEQEALTGVQGGDEQRYRVIVDLDSKGWRSRNPGQNPLPGMILEADIQGQRRTLIGWMVAPFQQSQKLVSGL